MAKNTTVRKPNGHKGAAGNRQKQEPLGREIWLDTARRALIEEGTAGIEINKLAKRLGVSRGGFYWFFKDRAQLLEELLEYWTQRSTVLFERILQPPGRDGMDEFQNMTDLWVDESEYDPKWDGAIRDWARTSESVRKVVHTVDQSALQFSRGSSMTWATKEQKPTSGRASCITTRWGITRWVCRNPAGSGARFSRITGRC